MNRREFLSKLTKSAKISTIAAATTKITELTTAGASAAATEYKELSERFNELDRSTKTMMKITLAIIGLDSLLP